MKPFDVYIMYMALKRHFSSGSYDYFKYHGKINASESSFDVRKDKYFFHKIMKKYKKDVLYYMVSNFIKDKNFWIGNDGEHNYTEWKKRIESMSYTFKGDLLKIQSIDDTILIKNDNSHPILLKMLISEEINVESVILLQSILNFFPYWDKKMGDDIIWEEYKTICNNYQPFLKFLDKEKFRKIITNTLDS